MKIKILNIVLLLAMTATCFAQQGEHKVNINGGPSGHGTGDIGGFAVSLMHEYDFTRRFGMGNGFTTTIHWGKDRTDFGNPGIENRMLRYTTAGFQLTSFAQYHIIAKRDIKLSAHAGPILRYQSSSQPSIYSFSRNEQVYPEPFYVIYAYNDANLFTLGYNAGFTVRTRVAPRYFGGVRLAFQNDTNGDVITSATLLLERVFSKSVKR